jgi:hypothetical protein
LAAHGGERIEASYGLLDLPAVSRAEGLELLDGDRVQGIAQGWWKGLVFWPFTF